MSRRRRAPDAPAGVLLLDKPRGPSTRELLGVLARRLGIRRSGHCGTLDPLATGLVVVVTGAATRVQDLLTGHDKHYVADIRFGARSATDDSEGPIVPLEPAPRPVARARIESALEEFLGEIDQVPPAFSAIHIEGERLHRLARAGRLPEDIPARRVRIDRVEIVDFAWPDLRVEVDCGAGTYIRSLARDLGEALGAGAYLSDLRRTRSGPFRIEDARAPDLIELEDLQPMEDALARHPRVEIPATDLERLLQGKEFTSPAARRVAEDDLVVVEGRVVGRARAKDEGRRWRLKRLIRDPREDQSSR